MAQPNDSSVQITLSQLSGAMQEVYRAQLEATYFFSGNVSTQLIPVSGEAVVGEGLNIKYKTGSGYSANMTTDFNGPFPTPTNFSVTNRKLRFSESNPAANDFARLGMTARVSHAVLNGMTGQPGAIVDFAQEVLSDLRADGQFILAMQMNLPRTGLLGTIGVPRVNDGVLYADCTSGALPAGTTRIRVVVTGPISRFQRGMLVDFYNGNTLVANSVRVTDARPEDNSVGFERSELTLAANLNAVATGQALYFRDSKDANSWSLGSWFSQPTAGEQFIFGVDRTTFDNRFLIPTRFVPSGATSASPVQISRSHFDALALAMGQNTDDASAAYKAQAHPAVIETLRNQIGEASYSVVANTAENQTRYGQFGSRGVVWQSPALGDIMLISDPLAPTTQVRVIKPDTWKRHTAVASGVQFLPGNTSGIWSRLPAPTPNTGGSMFYQCEAFANIADVCYKPQLNGYIDFIRA